MLRVNVTATEQSRVLSILVQWAVVDDELKKAHADEATMMTIVMGGTDVRAVLYEIAEGLHKYADELYAEPEADSEGQHEHGEP